MYNHSSPDQHCFICPAIKGIEADNVMIKQQDLVYQDDLVTVFINSFFINGNEGHLIVVPNKHIENLYDMEKEYGQRIIEVAQKMAIAVKKAYKCDGITLRQNNEPAGDQHAFHFHLHVFPRYVGDKYNTEGGNKREASPEERLEYVQKIKKESN